MIGLGDPCGPVLGGMGCWRRWVRHGNIVGWHDGMDGLLAGS